MGRRLWGTGSGRTRGSPCLRAGMRREEQAGRERERVDLALRHPGRLHETAAMTSPANRVPCHRCALGSLVIALALSVTLSGAREARADEPTINEVRYHPTELPPDGTRGRVLLTGAALTAGWYGIGVGTSYIWPDAKNARDLRIPVAGPWMALGNVGCSSKETKATCSDGIVVLRTTLAVLSGIGQAGGLFAFMEGLFLDTGNGAGNSSVTPPQGDAPRSERPQTLQQRRSPAVSQRTWAAVPVVLPDGAALQVVGQF